MNKQQLHDSSVRYTFTNCPHVYSAKFQLYLLASWLVNSIADLTTQHRAGHIMIVLSTNIRRATTGTDTIRSHHQGWSSVLLAKFENLPRDITPRVIGP